MKISVQQSKDNKGMQQNLLSNDLFNPSKFSMDDIMRHSMLLLSKDINFSAITKNDYPGKMDYSSSKSMNEPKSSKRSHKSQADNLSSYKMGKDSPR